MIDEYQKRTIKHLTSGKLGQAELDNIIHYIDTFFVPKKETTKRLARISGMVLRNGAEVLVMFRIGGKLYPATDENCGVMDNYLHSRDEQYLKQLEQEISV